MNCVYKIFGIAFNVERSCEREKEKRSENLSIPHNKRTQTRTHNTGCYAPLEDSVQQALRRPCSKFSPSEGSDTFYILIFIFNDIQFVIHARWNAELNLY